MVTAVTDADIKALILLEVGDNAAGLVASYMDLIWDSYADKALIGPRLQELYSKRRAIDVLLGDCRDDIDESDGGASLRTSQLVTALLELRKQTEAEIQTVEARTQASRAPEIGLITAVAPVSQPLPARVVLPPDANDSVYSGSPYRRFPGWWSR